MGVRSIVRSIKRSFLWEPLPVGLIVVSIALGLATSALALSVIDVTLVHPLPYHHAEKIIQVSELDGSTGRPRAFSHRFFYDISSHIPGVKSIAAVSFSDMVLNDGPGAAGDPAVVSGIACSVSMFDVLQIQPLRGRLFDRAEELAGAPLSVVLVGEELWRSRYGADSNILGKTITLNDRPFTVIGVLGQGLKVPPGPGTPAVWVPLGSDPLLAQVKKMFPSDWDRSAYLAPLWARAADGYSVDDIQNQVRSAGLPLLTQDDPDSEGSDLRVARVEDQIRDKYRSETQILILVSLLVLLVTSFNVSSLILVRALSRRKAIAVRLALGEGSVRAAAGVMAEAAMLSTVGVGIGLCVAELAAGRLALLIPAGLLPYRDIALTGRALLIATAVVMLCGAAGAIWPAANVARLASRGLVEALNRSSSETRSVTFRRRILVTAQIGCAAFAIALLASLMRTYTNITATRFGFNSDSVLVASLRMPQNSESGERWKNIGTAMIDDLNRQQGIVAAAITLSPPLVRSLRTSYTTPGKNEVGTGGLADYRVVGADYFDVLRIPILKGRPFSPSDRLGARPVCIVNSSFVRSNLDPSPDPSLSPNHDIGALIKPAGLEACEIVGIAGDVAGYDLKAAAPPAIYVPFDQMNSGIIQGFMTLLVRTKGSSDPYSADRLRETIKADAPTLPAVIRPLDAIVQERSSAERFRALLMAGVSAIAVLLSAFGIYGLAASYVIEQRRSLTIRVALGATGGRIIGKMLRDALVIAVAGLGIGIVAAYPALKLLEGVLFGTKGLTVGAVAIAALLIPAIACLAAYVPAKGIYRLNISDVLRDG